MKKLFLILTLCLMTSISCVAPIETYAYTEEEKQMAKDWLSAHGYSPTRAGAEQAYQDYLDGKFGDIYNRNNVGGKVEQNESSKKKEKKKKETAATASEATTETSPDETTAVEPEETETEVQTEGGAEESSKTDVMEDSKSEKETKEQQKKRKWAAMGIIGISVLVVVLGGFFVFFRKRE